MKKILLIITTLLTSLGALADDKSDGLLRALQSKIEALGDYSVRFRVTVDEQSLDGTYEVSANSYHIATPDIEVFCDGQTRWEVNMLDEEVLIDIVNPTDRTILGNPTRMFDFLDGSYTHTYVGKATLKSGEANKIELNEINGNQQDNIDVYLDVATGLPVRITYRLDNLNADAVVDIESISHLASVDPSAFSYNGSRYDGFEIIDFR
jgi:outer membrane lipoprotein-sorting protein